jgi:hypothetical protein
MGTRPALGDDFRIQLEGRLERLEQAQGLYASLTRLLSGPGWQCRLRKNPGVLEAVRAQEASIVEALERVERRARQEQWPEQHPVRGILRTFQARRGALEALMRGRLEKLTLRTGEGLPERLDRLKELVLGPAAPLPLESEEVLLHGSQNLVRLISRPLPLGLPLVILFALLVGPLLPSQVLAVLYLLSCLGVLIGLPLGMDLLKPGRFWLTPERLVWKPLLGEAVQVRLSSIPPGGITQPRPTTVCIEGDRKLALVDLPEARKLAELLQRLRGARR